VVCVCVCARTRARARVYVYKCDVYVECVRVEKSGDCVLRPLKM